MCLSYFQSNYLSGRNSKRIITHGLGDDLLCRSRVYNLVMRIISIITIDSHTLIPELPVERPVLDRLRDEFRFDLLGAFQVGNRSSDLEYPVVRAR